MLEFVADSAKMPGWDDALSCITDPISEKAKLIPLSNDELDMVAAGVDMDKELILKLKQGLLR